MLIGIGERSRRADDVLLSSVVRYMRSIGGGVELVLKTPDGKRTEVDLTPDIAPTA